MQRKTFKWLWFLGGMLIVFGLQLGMTSAQDDENEYVGIRECRACHRSYANDLEEAVHFRTLIDIAEAEEDDMDIEDIVLASFEDDSEEIRTIPQGDDSRPFTLEDIVYTLGAGRHYQAYVADIDGVLRVLPAQWSVAEENWVPVALAEDWSDPAYDFSTQCAACHTTNFDYEEFEWEDEGVQCEACHGPGLLHVEAADDAGSSISDEEYDALSSAINFGTDAQVCGRCHLRGTNEETGSPFPMNYHPGMALEETFTPFAPDNADAWYATGHARLPNMQYNEWLQSSHTTALTTAQSSENFGDTCIACHSVAQRRVEYLIDADWVDEDEFDKLSTLEAHAYGVTCTSCHNPHEVDNDTLLREEEPYELCIACHNNGETNEGIHHPVQEMFEGLEFVEGIEPVVGSHYGAEEGPNCLSCHMTDIETKSGERASHAFKVIAPEGEEAEDSPQGTCLACHDGLQNPDVQFLIDGVQQEVRDRIVVSSARLGTLEQPDPESDMYDTFVQMQNALAFIQGDGSLGVHNYAYADALLTYVDNTLTQMSVPDTDPVPTVGPAPTSTPIDGIPETIYIPPVRVEGGFRPMTGIILGIVFIILSIAAIAFFRRSNDSEV